MKIMQIAVAAAVDPQSGGRVNRIIAVDDSGAAWELVEKPADKKREWLRLPLLPGQTEDDLRA